MKIFSSNIKKVNFNIKYPINYNSVFFIHNNFFTKYIQYRGLKLPYNNKFVNIINENWTFFKKSNFVNNKYNYINLIKEKFAFSYNKIYNKNITNNILNYYINLKLNNKFHKIFYIKKNFFLFKNNSEIFKLVKNNFFLKQEKNTELYYNFMIIDYYYIKNNVYRSSYSKNFYNYMSKNLYFYLSIVSSLIINGKDKVLKNLFSKVIDIFFDIKINNNNIFLYKRFRQQSLINVRNILSKNRVQLPKYIKKNTVIP